VYEGDRIQQGKKSYAISFTLRDENKTLTDAEIDIIMIKIAQSLETELGAQIRS
jgi:phenylalanyl-tRNA synthetase beta chain